jgi:hypothetical protein
MPSPFPGMDPYLEDPGFWVDVHLSLICESQARLNAELRPKYYARIDERVYLTVREEIHDTFLKVVERESRDVVTVIEILKPRNKVPNSAGRDSFEQNRRDVMDSPTHWVEIDLLRGECLAPLPEKIGPREYLVRVLEKGQQPRDLIWPIQLAQRLPIIPIPLRSDHLPALLDLQAALDSIYDRAGYDLRIDYRKEPHPPLDEKLTAWADQLLRAKELR